MSYRITIVAESPEQLKEKIEALLSRPSVFTETSSTINLTPKIKCDVADDDMEEVESPFAGAPSTSSAIVGELDVEGIPWNAAIHSSSKKTVKNGTWKIARGVTDEQVEAYKKSIRGIHQTISPAPVASPAVLNTEAHVMTAPVVVQAPVVAPMPNMNIPTGHSAATFVSNFAVTISSLITDGKITPDYVNQLKTHFGVAEIWQISDEQKAQVFEFFVANGVVQKVG